MARVYKDFERYVAYKLGDKRIRFYIKCRQRTIWKLKEWIIDIAERSRKAKKIPILVINSKDIIPPLVILKLNDFAKVIKE